MVAKVKDFLLTQGRRVIFDICLFLFIILMFQVGVYKFFNPDVGVLIYKAMLVSAGILHGHIAGKVIFGSIDWSSNYLFVPKVIGRIVFYVLCIFAYSRGG